MPVEYKVLAVEDEEALATEARRAKDRKRREREEAQRRAARREFKERLTWETGDVEVLS